MALASGSRLGPYEVVAPLGAGGMGEVYRAQDTKLGRDVPLKVVFRQNSIGLKSIDYLAGSLHTPTHDQGNAMAGSLDYGSS